MMNLNQNSSDQLNWKELADNLSSINSQLKHGQFQRIDAVGSETRTLSNDEMRLHQASQDTH